MAFPIRAPRNVTELLSAEAAMRAARAAGRMDDADVIRALLNEGAFDPEVVANSRFFQQFNPDLPRPDAGAAVRFIDRLDGTDLPVPEVNLVGDQSLQKAGRSYDSLVSGRINNLRNQPVQLNDIARANIAEAAAARQAAMADTSGEQMAAAAALAGALGLGGMVADTNSRLSAGGEGMAQAPEIEYPELERLPPPPERLPPPTDIAMPDVDLLPVDDAPIPSMPMATMTEEDMGLTDFSPMDTADLVAESRPIPDSTPTISIPAPKKPPMTAAQAAEHFSREAQTQIGLLNQYRRQGIDRATDSQMMAEIQNLHRLANEARRSASPLNYQR